MSSETHDVIALCAACESIREVAGGYPDAIVFVGGARRVYDGLLEALREPVLTLGDGARVELRYESAALADGLYVVLRTEASAISYVRDEVGVIVRRLGESIGAVAPDGPRLTLAPAGALTGLWAGARCLLCDREIDARSPMLRAHFASAHGVDLAHAPLGRCEADGVVEFDTRGQALLWAWAWRGTL